MIGRRYSAHVGSILVELLHPFYNALFPLIVSYTRITVDFGLDRIVRRGY